MLKEISVKPVTECIEYQVTTLPTYVRLGESEVATGKYALCRTQINKSGKKAVKECTVINPMVSQAIEGGTPVAVVKKIMADSKGYFVPCHYTSSATGDIFSVTLAPVLKGKPATCYVNSDGNHLVRTINNIEMSFHLLYSHSYNFTTPSKQGKYYIEVELRYENTGHYIWFETTFESYQATVNRLVEVFRVLKIYDVTDNPSHGTIVDSAKRYCYLMFTGAVSVKSISGTQKEKAKEMLIKMGACFTEFEQKGLNSLLGVLFGLSKFYQELCQDDYHNSFFTSRGSYRERFWDCLLNIDTLTRTDLFSKVKEIA